MGHHPPQALGLRWRHQPHDFPEKTRRRHNSASESNTMARFVKISTFTGATRPQSGGHCGIDQDIASSTLRRATESQKAGSPFKKAPATLRSKFLIRFG